MIAIKALFFNNILYPDNHTFKASIGFCQNFCNRNNFVKKKQYGEQLSADINAIEPFLLEFKEI